MLEGLDAEVAGWLAPLLEDLPARRVQQAADALCLLDQPSLPVVAGVAAAVPAGVAVSKQVLHNRLVSTYGPMVELLLDGQPSQIPPKQMAVLRERLVAAGLALADVQEAMRQAELEPPPALAVTPLESAPSVAPTVESPPAAAAEVPLLQALRLAIGPIADLLWTAEMAAAAGDPLRLQGLLQQAGVPEAAARSVVEQAAVSEVPPPLAAPPEPAAAPSTPVAVDGEQLLLRLIGPIGSAVWADVALLPEPERLAALEVTLRGYGLDEASLAELRRQLEGG